MRTEREDPLITQKQWNAKLRELRVAKELFRAAEASVMRLEADNLKMRIQLSNIAVHFSPRMP